MGSCTVRDPLGRPVAAKYALVNRGVAKTAVMDMSEASGLWRVAADERCVERQSTYGTGEMLAHALRCGRADRVVIGLGGALRMTAVWGSPRRSVFVFWTAEDWSWSRFRRICLDSKR